MFVFSMGGSSSFDPSQLSNLSFWLDANNSGSITQSGGLVSQWTDLSSNAYVFNQTTGANQPTYTASAVNSKPGVFFGANTWLRNGVARILGSSNSQPITFFLVVSGYAFTVNDFPSVLQTLAPAGVGNVQLGFSRLAPYANAFCAPINNSWGQYNTTSGFGSANTPYALSLTYNGAGESNLSNFALYSSNVLQTFSAGGVGGATTPETTIGSRAGTSPLSGNICEMIAYSRVLNSTERAQIETYFTGKYGI
jgi:hypothetical protein